MRKISTLLLTLAVVHVATALADADIVNVDSALNPDFVKTALPQSQKVADTLAVTGKLALDRQQLRIASARVAGRLGRIFVFEGQTVRQGAPLAEIYSPDFIAAQQEFLLSRRFRDTLAQADAELKSDADATYESAANKLRVLGATDADIRALASRGQPEQYLAVRAPISGVVTQRNVDPGGYLNIGDTLMTVANPRTLWLYFNIYGGDYARLKTGQALTFTTPSIPGQSFSGRVSFIAPALDPVSHTLQVRCDIPNADNRLRPEMFINGELQLGEQAAWVVPRAAVFHIRDRDYVFVQTQSRQFRRSEIQGHALADASFAVTQGIDGKQAVVVDGGLLLNQLAAAH